ncbi:hypothetical protein [Pandoraea sputorum]|uniref:hypothetical protein n=1 Tax=Pandoraea sputorum TaxID=93222 RepID=UPI002F3E865E
MKAAFQRIRTACSRIGIAIGLITASGFVHAAGENSTTGDLSALTSGISMGSATAAIVAVALTLVGVYSTLRGAKIVIGLVRGG